MNRSSQQLNRRGFLRQATQATALVLGVAGSRSLPAAAQSNALDRDGGAGARLCGVPAAETGLSPHGAFRERDQSVAAVLANLTELQILSYPDRT